MIFSERMNYYLSRNFKNSEALELLDIKLSKYPYDYLKLVRFSNESYKDFNQEAKIDYRIDPINPRDITIVMDVFDGYKKNKIIFEIRKAGNEVNVVTRKSKEDTKLFHIRYNRDDTIDVSNRKIRFFNTDKEEIVENIFSKFYSQGILLDYINSNEMYDSVNKNRRRLV